MAFAVVHVSAVLSFIATAFVTLAIMTGGPASLEPDGSTVVLCWIWVTLSFVGVEIVSRSQAKGDSQ